MRQVVMNTSWLFADRAIALLVGLFLGAWLARYLAPAQFGQYNYAVAFSALFAPLASLGLASPTIRELVRTPTYKGTILGTVFVLQLIAGTLSFVIAVAGGHLLHRYDALTGTLITILSAGVIFQAVTNTIDCWFQSQVQSKYMVWARNTALLLTAATQVVLILIEASLITFAIASLAQLAICAVAAGIAYGANKQQMHTWRYSTQWARSLLATSWPLAISGVAVVVYMRIDLLMLGRMTGEESLGVYSVAVRLSELWYFLPVAVATSVFPSIVRSRETQPVRVYLRRLQLFYDISAIIAYSITVPCALLASPIINWLFGPAYQGAGPILSIRIWAFLFVSVGVARNQYLYAEKMTRFAMAATILGAISNITLNLILIPTHGALGAAWATLISQAISAYLSSLLVRSSWLTFRQISLSLLAPFRLAALCAGIQEMMQS